MAKNLPFFLFFFFSFVFFCTSYAIRGEQRRHIHLISVSSLLPSSNCSSSDVAANDGKMLKVVHRRGPCSPLGQRRQLDHRRVLRLDRRRVKSLHRRRVFARSKLGNSLAAATTPGRSGLAFGNADYVVTVGFGTPKRDMSVIFDTGSDLSWIQCQPCTNCYQQKEPIFDPSKSSTISGETCDSDYCSTYATTCVASSCYYSVRYGDNSYSEGLLVKDTLSLTPSDELEGFVFGCGDHNQGLFGEVSGLVGLGRNMLSLVSQSSPHYGGAFSYCIPPYASTAGYLTLGQEKQPPPNTQFISLLSEPDEKASFYFVELEGLSVGGKELNIPPAIFSKPGTIIDSGTVLTYLPTEAHSELQAEFQRQMAHYPRARRVDGALADACYNFTGYNTVEVPEVALHFNGGVTLNVDASGILFVDSISMACLAFATIDDTNELSIVGNMQQKAYSVFYDVPNGKLGFSAAGCG